MGKKYPVTHQSRQKLETKKTIDAMILEMLVVDGCNSEVIADELGLDEHYVKHVIREAEKKGKIHSTWWSWHWRRKKK
ncbi:MAG: hypothetical protein A2Y62_09590 [Candidatus Fischerbacteria bacterium RBG_13_37_8]|uniref:Uncharacterized protein n=1 Tax=Candidatus Fischerbacteria bacterium RBG_13_37_8 TaxID=1817863 RepID=A0A1F5V5S4_9BACT|nr:MAG: hypothetical protein A2Y62_09590 [Candidatus Fischerbacteria bacterium RBG_13_37_8]